MLKRYLLLTKPGIVFGNLISVTGGFFLASKGSIDLLLFFATVIGVSLVVASGCVFNNVIDRDIDEYMARTQKRALVEGTIDVRSALIMACLLGTAGFLLLLMVANPLSAGVALFGFAIYVGAYSLWLKRHSVHGTLIGSLSGAAPPVIGYCAVSNQFDLGAWLVLLIFSLWQMPHSYAIAIFRLEDYRAASIPVLSVAKGVTTAKRQTVAYIVAFGVAATLLTFTGYTGYVYLVVMTVMTLYWLYIAVARYHQGDDGRWARQLFGISILVVTVLSAVMAIDYQKSAPETTTAQRDLPVSLNV
ncbi:heme o synthase [Kushneria marisflavi]|uniref:Protoheme IX farnesyltransferase n=1 Tax=Kushneria marisflavi TaxID=157779 RepID=A0A240UR29_9GAMM|nr:heme o synthase [Kushneria marisflavi]ART63586.1 protoheme IX farnesyltransferase [Kushneria marisflavi]RKD85249.1 protoheme IX farnesyltransferase [Kushneria marisflavi]